MLKRIHPFVVPLIGLGVFFCWLLPARGAEPEADPVQAFRQRLADPERLAVRDGDELDLEAVVLQMEAFLDEHGALLRRRFAASLEDIPRGEMPDRGRHEQVAVFDEGRQPDGKKHLRLNALLAPEAKIAVRRALNMWLVPHMVGNHDWNHRQAGSWIGFLDMAEPSWRLLQRSDEQVLLLADYGGQDLFIAKLVPHQGIWIAETIAWWRPKKDAAQK